jgi:hypothetical protein
MQKIIFLLVGLTLLTSCASLGIPKVAEFKVPPGSKIGILVEEDEAYPTHRHVGTTVFNNFSKSYENEKWVLKPSIEENLYKYLSKDDLYTVMNLEDEGVSYNDIGGLIVYKNGEWVVDSSKSSVFEKLKNQFDLDAVIVAKEQEVLAYLECTGGPCTSWTVDSSGLFTRSFLNIKNYWAVAAFDTNIYILDTPTNAAVCESFRKFEDLRSSNIRHSFKPKNLKEITSEEWSQVKNQVDTYLNSMTEMIPELLINGCESQ